MTTQTLTLELPEALHRSVRQIAAATKRPLGDVVTQILAHALPPLDDVPAEDAELLARMSALDDGALWHEARATLSAGEQAELGTLLDRQGAQELAEQDRARLRILMDEYGRLMVRKSHAWLLLARRGYQIPALRP